MLRFPPPGNNVFAPIPTPVSSPVLGQTGGFASDLSTPTPLQAQAPAAAASSTAMTVVKVLIAILLAKSANNDRTQTNPFSLHDADPDNRPNSGGVVMSANDNEYFDYKQGQTGDCAVLSAISSVAMDTDGKALLDRNVKANGDGSYTVKLQGTGETFQISKADMANDKLSKGEPKVRAYENAVKQHYAKRGDNFEGKGGPDIFKLLTGKQTKSLKEGNNPEALKRNLLKLAETDTDGFSLEVGAKTLKGSETKGMHGYAVTEINKAQNTVSYTNPWDANKIVTVSLDDFVRDLTAQGSGGVDYAEI